ncbi:O-methyltransferase [Lacrimispora saccharolytica]|uniref:O-methyltransferase n=1 Tax=Lacrimispora saccharolytica TaxID=84030 RepID=UPI001B5A43F3|nr:O-methyltransferase [Lacrimispora saccharolytica]MBP9001548.1 O-methyltransferase [Lachnospiraceae bacterium]MCF2656426.1 O-methyltransferase [Lacrimispora saccharolytica]
MIVSDRMTTFINSLDPGNPEYLDRLEEEAIADFVPIIRKDMQAFLKFMMRLCKPRNILEVGTAVGFSALLMSEYAPEAHITTIENYEKRIPIARDNIAKAGKSASIDLISGDATEILPTLTDTYDFIFMDAAKGQYINFLPEIMRLLSKGGILVSDNVLQDGDIIESRFAVVRRDRTIHTRMREYLYTLKHMEGVSTVILPVGDGITVTVKE